MNPFPVLQFLSPSRKKPSGHEKAIMWLSTYEPCEAAVPWKCAKTFSSVLHISHRSKAANQKLVVTTKDTTMLRSRTTSPRLKPFSMRYPNCCILWYIFITKKWWGVRKLSSCNLHKVQVVTIFAHVALLSEGWVIETIDYWGMTGNWCSSEEFLKPNGE